METSGTALLLLLAGRPYARFVQWRLPPTAQTYVGGFMEQRISLITLSVADLRRAAAFYERVVGWKAESSPPGGCFFRSQWSSLRPLAARRAGEGHGYDGARVPAYRGYALAHNVRSEAEVDAIFGRLKEHGATILKQPQKLSGRILGVFFRPGWTYMGDGLQSLLDHSTGRPRVYEKGVRRNHIRVMARASCRSATALNSPLGATSSLLA